MAKNKTVKTSASVEKFVNSIENERRRADSLVLLDFMHRITGMNPRMWGESIIGYGEYHYKYESGHEGDSCLLGFSPRKSQLSLYVMPGFKSIDSKLARLGKHRKSVACLYVNKLADIDMEVLEEIVVDSLKVMQERYPDWKPT